MSPLPTQQQRFALRELEVENERRARNAGCLDATRVAFFLDRLVGPPVDGHALVARGRHTLACECGKWRLWTWRSLDRGKVEGEWALRHDAHRNQ